MKCVLVTGGAGFLGSHLCDRLIKSGNYVGNYGSNNKYKFVYESAMPVKIDAKVYGYVLIAYDLKEKNNFIIHVL